MSSTRTIENHSAINPFPGLRPFKIEESHLFFGREGQTDEVLLKLSKSRFVGVIGPSGAGKSSFIYCGVLPILYGGFLTDASADWNVVVTRPGSAPIDNLAEALLKHNAAYLALDEGDKKIKRTIISTLLRTSSLGLVEALQQSGNLKDTNYLILVDQFEELFRFKDRSNSQTVNEALAFVNLLVEAADYPDSPFYVAITMRSDFIGDCAQFPELTTKLNESHYLIPQLTREQKRRAIEGPMAVGGAKISSRLTQQLLNDLGDNPDQLPILQHALMRTWSYWHSFRDREEEPVDLIHYEAIGTMQEALSLHANEAYDELDEDQKNICEVLFKAITEKRGENFGVRRPTRLSEIAAIAEVSEDQVVQVIDKFRDPGRSLLTPGFGVDIGPNSMIDISHESLMRIWVRLKNWVEDEGEAVQMYMRLSEAAAMYQVGKAGLWRPPDLQLALNWHAKHKPTLVWGQRYNPAFERTLVFLEYSKKEWETEQRVKELEQKRKLKMARAIALVFGGLTIMALLAFVFAFLAQSEANQKAEEARQNLSLAKENEQKAIHEKELADSARAEAVRQKEIALVQQRIAEEQKNIAENQTNIANQQRVIALTNEQRAKENELRANLEKERAEQNEKIAMENAELARQEEQRARNLRYRAIAKAMAIKSVQLSNDEQEALLAQQAYNFNTEYKGYLYDNDIYDGLYNALKKYDDPLTQSLKGHTSNVRALVASPKKNLLFSGGAAGKILKWAYQDDRWTARVVAESASYRLITCMDISPDERWLAVGGNFNPSSPGSNFVELYDLKNLTSGSRKIEGFVGEVGDIRFTPGSDGFYVRDNEGHSIRYCNLTTVEEVITSNEKIRSIDLNSKGSQLAGVCDLGNQGKLVIWDTRQFSVVDAYHHPKAGLYSVAFDPEGKRLVVGDANGLIRMIMAGMVVRELPGHESAIQDIKFNSNGTFLATASKDKSVRLWNLSNLKEQPIKLYDHPNWVWSIAFSPDDEQLLAGTQEQIIKSWPTKIETMSGKLCQKVSRNMTKDEWDIFVSEDLEYVSTCENLPSAYNK